MSTFVVILVSVCLSLLCHLFNIHCTSCFSLTVVPCVCELESCLRVDDHPGLTFLEVGLEKTMLDYDHMVFQIFQEYMTRVTKIDKLTGIGCRFLGGFQHELEIFRKPPMDKISKFVEGIVEAHCTKRMSAYAEAGHRDAHADKQNTSKLHSHEEALREHISKVQMLINELEGLVEDAIGIVKEAYESTNSFSDKCTWDVMQDPHVFFQKDEKEVAERFIEERSSINATCQRILHYAIMMRMMYNMLSKDYAMQEKVVLSLSLASSSDELESYCRLWELRPFVDDEVLKQCWRFV